METAVGEDGGGGGVGVGEEGKGREKGGLHFMAIVLCTKSLYLFIFCYVVMCTEYQGIYG